MGEVRLTLLLCRWTIWGERVKALEKFVLDKWDHFTIWNAGKQGKRLYRSLSPQSRAKVQGHYLHHYLISFLSLDPLVHNQPWRWCSPLYCSSSLCSGCVSGCVISAAGGGFL